MYRGQGINYKLAVGGDWSVSSLSDITYPHKGP